MMKSLASALRILSEFTERQPDFGVGELARRLGLPKSQVSKVLSTFREFGIVVQDPATRRYSVGVRAFVLGSRFVNYHRLTKEAMPVLRQLVDRTRHSARLSIMDRDRVVYLVGIEGPLFIDTGWRAGHWMPLHASTAGRVILAFLDEARVDELIEKQGMPALTPKTVADMRMLKTLLSATRQSGFGVMRDETTMGLGTIGVPIFGNGQEIIGVLGLAFPTHLLPPSDEARHVAALHHAARHLSLRMGCSLYPFGGQPPTSGKPGERAKAARRPATSAKGASAAL